MDAVVQRAREAHRKCSEHSGLSHHYRLQRDELIRKAYSAGTVSYGSLAKQIGCSPELVAKAVQGRT